MTGWLNTGGQTRSAGGWGPGIPNGSALKPKGMHWRTLERLHGQHDAHVNAALVGMAAAAGADGGEGSAEPMQ